mmetsp:Transcript_21045/g.67815  ORF Transcript_21045/g.67815 Transcript_21045/m.67815 type:complete len:127 (-) Transcript_21045:116-496(-)
MLHADLFVSNQKLVFAHVGAPVLWGVWYIAFAWVMAFRERWVAYPFIDFTLAPAKAFAMHLGLTLVLALFFLLGVQFDTTLHATPTAVRLVAHAALLAAVTKFRQKPFLPHAAAAGTTTTTEKKTI